MLAGRPHRRVYRRPTLTGSQRAAYYGIPMITPSTSMLASNETTSEDKEKEDVAENEKSSLQGSIPAAANAYPNQSAISSFNISKSALDAFNRTKKTVADDDEEDVEEKENSQEVRKSYGPYESSNASYTISKSAIGVFNRTKKSTTTTDDEESELHKSTAGLDELSKASYTISKSAIGIFNRTQKTIADDEEEYEEKENSQQVRKSYGPSETSTASYTISKSAIGVFNHTKKTIADDDEEENSQEVRKSYGPSESSTASYTISKSAIDVFNRTQKTTTTIDDVAENEKSSLQESIPAAASVNENESAISSFNISQSALDAFNRTKRTSTTTTTDGEEDESKSQKSVAIAAAPYPNESAISSFNISQSALEVFDRTKKTAVDDGEEEITLGNNDEADASDETLTDSTIEPMEVDEPPLTPKRTPQSSKSIFGVSSFSQLLNDVSIAAPATTTATSNSQPPNFIPNNVDPTVSSSQPPISSAARQSNVAPVVSSSQPLKSRAALLLPRFMQPTTSSTAHASTQPISCASPICGKPSKAAPLQLRKQHPEQQQQPSKQRPHFTPRKSVAVVRKIADQSFNAAKLPELDMTLYEGIPRAPANPPINNALSYLRKSVGKRAHPVTPQQPKGSITFAASRNKDKFNLTSAFSLLQQYESPVTPRVAPKRFTPSAPTEEVEPNVASVGNLLKEIVIQTPSPSEEEDILQTSNNSNRSNLVEKENEACRRSIGINEINNPSTVDAEVLKSPLHDNNRDMYDNDAGNFSALSPPVSDEEYDKSIYSINTPGPSRPRPIYRTKPFIPSNFINDTLEDGNSTMNDSFRTNRSSVKIVASKTKNNQNKQKFVLAKRHIIKPETPPYDKPNLRRSTRNRVKTCRKDLGQQPVYEYDENGLPTLVDVTDVVIQDPRAIKYMAVDKAEQNQKERELKHRQKVRKEFAKQQRERELEF